MIKNLIFSRSLFYKVKGDNDNLKVSLRIMFPAAGSQPAQVFLAGKAGDMVSSCFEEDCPLE